MSNQELYRYGQRAIGEQQNGKFLMGFSGFIFFISVFFLPIGIIGMLIAGYLFFKGFHGEEQGRANRFDFKMKSGNIGYDGDKENRKY
jgi:purine-cytosine permease-like protein